MDVFASLTHAGINRHPVGDCPVEPVSKGDRGRVADLELHGDDGGNPLLHKTLGYPGERVRSIISGSFTGIQDYETQ